jgi:Fur family transcriptional regulator, peroxide stress response regulator
MDALRVKQPMPAVSRRLDQQFGKLSGITIICKSLHSYELQQWPPRQLLTHITKCDRLPAAMKAQPAEIAERIKILETLCRSKGVPCTAQRRVVLRAVLERDDHPTADEVLESVKGQVPGISRTTVYRVLDTLAEWGLIRRLQHAGAVTRFDGETRRHHHLVCNKCYRVIDVHDAKLDRLRVSHIEVAGFDVEDFSVHLMGTCEACRRAEEQ